MKLCSIRFHSAIASSAIVVATFSGCNLNIATIDGYSFDYSGETAETLTEGTFTAGITQIEVVNKFGNVKITVADGEPKWTWDSKVWADTQELADEYLQELLMHVDTNGTTQTWTVSLPDSSSDLNGFKSNLTLMIPASVKVKLENRHGKVDVSKLASEVELINGHGDVTLTDLQAKVVAKNAHGNLTASNLNDGEFNVSHGNSDIQSAENISINSSHGSVKAAQVAGALIVQGSHSNITVDSVQGSSNIKTSHGNIAAMGLAGNVTTKNSHGSTNVSTRGELVSIYSSHGKILLTMNSDSFQSIDLETTHSDINVALPANVIASIKMNTTHGDTSSEVGSNAESSQKVQLKNQHGNIRVTKI